MSHNISTCWGKALLCPSDDDDTSGIICEAWYRCEGVSDYVIRWRCHMTKEISPGLDSRFRLCTNSTNDMDMEDCPPPVVCPATAQGPEDERAQVVTDVTTDVILASVLGAFALLAIILMAISTYKYWKIKRRLRLKMFSKQRTFPHALRHYSWWGLSPLPYERKKMVGQTGKCQGIHYTDVYVPRDVGHDPFPHQHLVTSDSSRDGDNNLVFYDDRKSNKGNGGGLASGLDNSHHRFGDPSVITGSFVYQPSGVVRGTGSQSDQTSGSPNYSTKTVGVGSSMTQAGESVGSFWHQKSNHNQDDNNTMKHSQRASLSEFYFMAQNPVLGSNPPHFDNHQNSNKNRSDVTTHFTGRSHISSIPIPTYAEMEKLHERKYFQPLSPSRPRKMYFNASTKRGSSRRSGSGKVGAHNSEQSRVAGHFRIHASSVRPVPGDQRPSQLSQNDQHPYSEYGMSINNNTIRGNPDLIRDHDPYSRAHGDAKESSPQETSVNVTNNYVDITADYDASGDNFSAASINYESSVSGENSSNNSSDSGRKFILTGQEHQISSELSYDSFRNEHLRDLARQGPASSSTLDNGFRYMVTSDLTSSSTHQYQ